MPLAVKGGGVGIAENRAVRGSWNALETPTINSLQGKTAKADLGQEVLITVVVAVADNAVVGTGAVELGIEQRLPLAVVEICGEHYPDPFERSSVGGAPVVSSKAGGLERKFGAVQVFRSTGNDVHHCEESARPV